MATINVTYVVLLVGALPLILASLYYVLNDTRRPGARPLAVLLTGTLIWLLSAVALEIAPTFEVALWANRFQYFGITGVPLAFVLFALEYVGRDDLVNKYSVGLLSIEPIAAIALVWTNTSHSLWSSEVVGQGATYTTPEGAQTCGEVICFGVMGQGFLAHTIYSYVILLVGAVLVLSRPIRSSAIPRGQAVSMAVAVGAPLAANALSLFVLPSSFPDLTPVAFGMTGVALVVGLYRYSLVDTSALTAEAGVTDSPDAAVLVSDDDEIVELNVEAAKVLGVDADTVVGSDVDTAFAEHEPLRAGHGGDPGTLVGLELTTPISGETYKVDVSTIDPDGTPQTGRLYEFNPRV